MQFVQEVVFRAKIFLFARTVDLDPLLWMSSFSCVESMDKDGVVDTHDSIDKCFYSEEVHSNAVR